MDPDEINSDWWLENAERNLAVAHQLIQWIQDQVEAAEDCKLKGDLQFTIGRYRDVQLLMIQDEDLT
jgi:hypothetical protein